jgi:hypothetical protein
MRLRGTFLGLVMLAGSAVAQAAPAELPSDPRLSAVRPRLQAVLAKAEQDGLAPELRDLIVRQVRDGLAKNIDAGRIETAAARLGDSLNSSSSFVRERRSEAAVDLVRAVAEAKLSGVDLAAADGIVRSSGNAEGVARAVEVLTDLNLRGYPVERAAGVVKDVLGREPAAVGRVPATLETVRIEQALTHAETVDAVARGLRGGNALAAAARRAADEKPGRGAGGVGKGEGPGKGNSDGFVPPGQLKKQNGAQEAKGNMGKGMGQGMGKGPDKK